MFVSRKRDLSQIESLSPSNKRQCLPTDAELTLAIADRCLSILIQNQTISKQLPTNLNDFFQFVHFICSCEIQIDPTVVFYHLILNCVISIQDDFVQINHQSPNDLILHAYVASDQEEEEQKKVSPEFQKALIVATNWVGSLSNQIQKFEEFFQKLKQICQIQRNINSQLVVSQLISRRLFQITFDSTLIWSLPTHLSINTYYYSPIELIN